MKIQSRGVLTGALAGILAASGSILTGGTADAAPRPEAVTKLDTTAVAVGPAPSETTSPTPSAERPSPAARPSVSSG
jgi:hypothetical protein